jgi:DNA-binding MarR family transcriptional regulator
MSFLLRNAQQVLISAEENLKHFRDIVNYTFHKNNYDITYDQWVVLHALAENQGISQISLSESTQKEPASISRILKLLEQKEMIEKLSDKKNKRAKRIYLTAKGDEVQKIATKTFNKIAKDGFVDVHEQEINLFVRILDKLQTNFKNLDQRGQENSQ